MSKMHRPDATVDDAMLRKKEQKDVELDKKIMALRKKNEALMRRYQEIEEDRKRAEQEGMAVTSRRVRPDGLTITITKAHNACPVFQEKRVVNEKWGSSPASSFGIGSEEEEEEADHLFTFRMGKRVQLAVTMDNKTKGKRVVSEKRGSECLVSPGEAPDISEDEVEQLVAFRRGRRMQIAITVDNKGRVEEKRTVERRWSEGDKYSESALIRKERGKSPQKNPGDKACTMTGRERSEYVRWKKERDQIDLERLARHKNARGEWRRAWDAEKSERMFEDTKDGELALDGPHSKKGGKNTRKPQHRPMPSDGKGGGQHRRSTSESASRTLPVTSSKARGKDRLTGRARRWDAKEGEEVPFVKDETENQRSADNEQLKNQALASETVKEDHSPTGLDKDVKPQEHNVSMPPVKSDASLSAGEEDQGINEKARRHSIQDVSAISVDETESDRRLNNKISQDALLPKVNGVTSNSCHEGNLPVQDSENVAKEISSTVYEDDIHQNAHSERNPSGEGYGEKDQLKAEVGDGRQVQEEETQIAGLEKQMIHEKEGDAPAFLVHREESRSPGKEMPDQTNEAAEVTKMMSKEQDQCQPCNNQEVEG
ncbi:coiled-coil domain-containing protein 9B isoform X1 [Pogona vitticeps]